MVHVTQSVGDSEQLPASGARVERPGRPERRPGVVDSSLPSDRPKLVPGCRDADICVKAVIDAYMAAYRGRDSSRLQRLTFWVDTVGELKLSELTDDEVFASLEGLAARHGRYFAGLDADGEPILKAKKRPLSAATLNRYQAALSSVLTWATRQRITPRGWQNPCKLVALRPENNGIVRFLSDDERIALLAACRRSVWPRLYLLVLLALTTGARRGELEALTWQQVDFERSLATVDRSKNGDKKVLPLVTAVLEEMRRFQGHPSSLLFPSKRRPVV